MRRWAFVVTMVLVLVLLPGAVMAGEDEGTRTLGWFDHVDVRIDNSGGKTLSIEYDVNVTDGVPVNVYFMDEEAYEDYVDPMVYNISYDVEHSTLRTMDAHEKWTWSEAGVFYIVIDNTGYSSMDTATVRYTVTWTPGGLWGYPWWCWVILVVVIIIALGLGWIFRRRGTGTPPAGEGTFDGAQVLERIDPGSAEPVPMDEGGTAGTPPPPGMHTPMEGAAELSPQPEPPDAAVRAPGEGYAELSPQPEPPDAAVRTPGEGSAELSPQPEPPDAAVRTPGEGYTELGPQPEPPDLPAERSPRRPNS